MMRRFARFGWIGILLMGLGSIAWSESPAPSPQPSPLTQESPKSPALFTVVDGYLVAHLPGENVTVIAQKPKAEGVDTGWATWTQRGGLLWRGQMEDSQGRLYNIRILPGYVSPMNYAIKGWSAAGTDLGEYGDAKKWKRMGEQSKDCFRWSWKDSFWEFGLKGSGQAWSKHLETAKNRVERKTFGWPLAYPWAVISSTFETLLRVPLGTLGAAGGTVAGGIIVPAAHAIWPATKATYHAGIDGVVLPVIGWTWQTLAAPPAALFASAPNPSRADGIWMKVMPNPSAPDAAQPIGQPLSKDGIETLARYAQETSVFAAEEARAQKLEQDELKALRTRQAEARKLRQDARAQKLQTWAQQPENLKALQSLAKEGADRTSIRASRAALEKRLRELGLNEIEAAEAIHQLMNHPLCREPRTEPASHQPYDKTDPIRGALDTVDNVARDKR